MSGSVSKSNAACACSTEVLMSADPIQSEQGGSCEETVAAVDNYESVTPTEGRSLSANAVAPQKPAHGDKAGCSLRQGGTRAAATPNYCDPGETSCAAAQSTDKNASECSPTNASCNEARKPPDARPPQPPRPIAAPTTVRARAISTGLSVLNSARGAVAALRSFAAGPKDDRDRKQVYVTDAGHAVSSFDDGFALYVEQPPFPGAVSIVHAGDVNIPTEELSIAMERVDSSKRKRIGNPTDRYNCHGYVFTNGEDWVRDDQVAQIIRDNGYVQTNPPRPGDLVAYFKGGVPVHTGVVAAVENGVVTKVRSKWARGSLFEHPPRDVPRSYGTDIRYYQTSRPQGHALRPR